MRELIAQMGHVHRTAANLLSDPQSSILDVDRTVTNALRSSALPTEATFGYPLAGSLLRICPQIRLLATSRFQAFHSTPHLIR